MSTISGSATKANWDELADNGKFPRPPAYHHPWPSDDSSDYSARDLDATLGLEHMSVVLVRIGPGQSGTHHRHATAEEVLALIEGACRVIPDDEVIEARKLDTIRVPPEVYHSFHNHTDEPCWWVVIGAPVDEFRPEGIAAYLAVNGYPPDTPV